MTCSIEFIHIFITFLFQRNVKKKIHFMSFQHIRLQGRFRFIYLFIMPSLNPHTVPLMQAVIKITVFPKPYQVLGAHRSWGSPCTK